MNFLKAPQGKFARQQEQLAYILLAPTLIVILLVAAWPLYKAVSLSFTSERLGKPGQGEYIGFENYTKLLGTKIRNEKDGSTSTRASDKNWWESLSNTVVLTFLSVVLELIAGLFIAMVINSKFPGRGMMRTAVLIPWAIPTVVSAQMWAWMYNDVFGVFNYILQNIGIIEQPIAWLAATVLANHHALTSPCYFSRPNFPYIRRTTYF